MFQILFVNTPNILCKNYFSLIFLNLIKNQKKSRERICISQILKRDVLIAVIPDYNKNWGLKNSRCSKKLVTYNILRESYLFWDIVNGNTICEHLISKRFQVIRHRNEERDIHIYTEGALPLVEQPLRACDTWGKLQVHVNNLVQFLHVCVQNTWAFVFKICQMVEKIKTDVDKLLLILKMKKNFQYILVKLNFISISKPKVVYLRPFLSSLPLPKLLKQDFIYFSHKHVETESQSNLLIS